MRKNKMRTALLACIVLTLLLGGKAHAGPVMGTAQIAAEGSIRGAATDAAGAYIAGAQITAINEASGAMFQTSTDANGRYQLLRLPAGSYRLESNATGARKQIATAVEVDSGHATNVDISFSSPSEVYPACSCSMRGDRMEKLLRATSPRDPETALHLSVSSSREVTAGSEVWLTVVLTNIADHPISIPVEKNSDHAFAYNIGLSDLCNCPIGGARVGVSKTADDGSKNEDKTQESNPSISVLVLAPGASLRDRVELGKLVHLTGFRTYQIRASRPYSSAGTAVEQNVKPGQTQLSIKSNRISVTVMPPQRK